MTVAEKEVERADKRARESRRSICRDCGSPIVLAVDEAGVKHSLDTCAPVYLVYKRGDGSTVCAQQSGAMVGHGAVCRRHTEAAQRKEAKA